MRDDPDIKIFAGCASKLLTEKICAALHMEPGSNHCIRFSEGNIYVKFDEKVRGKDIYIVQTIGLDPNNEMMELLFWLDAAKRSGVNSVTAIMPYFGYAKADKKDEPRVSIRARVCADCMEAAGVDRVVTMDLHSAQIQGFFSKPVDHLYASNIFVENIRRQNLSHYSIVAPDEGCAKNARYYTNRLNVPLVIGSKRRIDHSETAEITGLMGEIEGMDAIIVDDFTISCGTLIETAKALKAGGAQKIYAYVSHGLLSKTSADKLCESPVDHLFTTDSVYNPATLDRKNITILSVAGLFARAIQIIHEKESLSSLF
ncbi:MAG: ribose-phosphate diphosphokinase [Defluviitaleaceae bacterium]|nr:ribose-phosphate diphosphokinase [Defluviitaleaceae bacterium]